MQNEPNSIQTLEVLEQKLDQFKGLKEVKLNIHAFIRLMQVWKAEAGQHLDFTPVPLHLIFAGEPGTGRTQAAELMGKIYHVLGFLSDGETVRANASELEEDSFKEVLSIAEGNVLLLSHPDSLTPEGAEILETLLNTHKENLAVILRGTRQEIEALFEKMPSLRIRFSKYFAFADFQEEDFQVKPSAPKFEIFDVSSLAEQEEQLEALQEAEFPVPEKPVPRKLDASARTGTLLKAGARLDLSDYLKDEIRIRLVYQKLKLPMEMDAYVFMLHENELTGCDEDMVFFGNLISKNGGAAIVDGAEYPETAFILSKVYQDIQKIAVCFSAYGDNPAFDFSQVEQPVLQIFHHNEQIAWMDLQNLKTERTLVAGELYRYQNTWKFRAVASGYRDGLEELCRRFGIEVE
ncbi:MAG: hypothetical protein E7496_07125 [Ruminococcus sp.]|nr:hypothetical protein [Ruminococcus sp.]